VSSYDVIVIGSGAGGGTLVHRLAPSGKRILLLERGDWLPREPQNWLAQEVFVDGRYISDETWYDAEDKPFQPQVHFHYHVGGATKLYGAALYRLREQDFGELRHHDGISPAWPIAYEQMEPYYTQAEQLYRVHGSRGEDPTEPPASAPYAFTAVSHEPRIQQLADDLAAIGHHPFHAPCGIMLDESNMPYSACVRCPDCDGFPCLVHAKSDAEVIAVRPAIEHENVTLLRNAEAVALRTNSAGTIVTEVLVDHDGQRETITADIVVVACGAANSAKLLLASATSATRAASRAGRTRSVATTCSTTASRCSPCPASRTQRCSRRRSASTTSTSQAGSSITRHNRVMRRAPRGSMIRRPRPAFFDEGIHMSTALEAKTPVAQARSTASEPRHADVLAVFGITGDLAKVMTFHSLYRLERRRLLDCPIVGVAGDDWTAEDLRKRARSSIEACGETIDETVFNRLAERNHIAWMEITMAESFGVEDRGHFYDPVGALRDVVVNHLMQVVAVAAMGAPAGNDADTLKDAKFSLFRSIEDASPAHYVRGQYDGYREIRAVFRKAPRLGFMSDGHRTPNPDQLVVKLDPSTGTRLILDAHRADSSGAQRITLDMEFAAERGEAPTPYEVLLLDAMRGDSARFTRQDSVEETWRIMQPLLDAPPPVNRYDAGSWGPALAADLLAGFGTWRGPWLA
jgi:hypothetical protein